MKKILYFIVILLFAGCSKDDNNTAGNAKLIVRMTYNSSDNTKSLTEKRSVTKAELTDDRYTQFGDYITSITPTVFIAKFLDMRLQNWVQNATMWNYSVNLIDNNSATDSPSRLADFSNNASVDLNLDLGGLTKAEFNIFLFMPMFFYQEIELPTQYDTVDVLDNINYPYSNIDLSSDAIAGVRNGRFIKGNNSVFMYPIYNNKMPGYFVFGSCDSSYSYFAEGVQNINNPIGQTGYTIRSKAFNNIIIEEPENNGDTTIISGTITYNIHNLIHIYAGQDNIPYTADDIFVYAPNFWERLSVSLIKKEE